MSQVTEFLLNRGPDHKGRKLDEIWDYDSEMFDHCHDFIQWMFPIPKPSKFFVGDNCPILTLEDVLQINDWDSRRIKDNLETNAAKFLSFLGLQLRMVRFQGNVDYTVKLSHSFSDQVKYWLKPNDHNHLRINRMIQCLVLCGLEDLAKAIFQCLVMVKCEFEDCITDTTMVYWRNALTGYSY